MKKIITAIALALICSGAYAQFNQGRYLVGGSLGFRTVTHKSEVNNTTTTQGKSTSFNLSPDVGYFVINNLAVGASVSLGAGSSKADGSDNKSTSSSVTFTPFVRYYLDPGIFFQGYVGGGSAKNEYKTGNTTTTTKTGIFQWGLGVGYAYFLNDFVAIEPMIVYGSNVDKNKDNDAKNIDNGLSINVGFQIYLGPRD